MKIPKQTFLLLILFAVGACSSTTPTSDSSIIGQTANDFSLPDQDGKIWKLSEVLKTHRGAVLAFYPKDDTKL